MIKKQFSIAGMHCVSCALTIEQALNRVPGVKKAAVNFATEKATVEHDDSVLSQSLVDAVKKTGYKLVPENSGVMIYHNTQLGHAAEEHETAEHDHHRMLKEAEISLLWKKFIVGAVLSSAIIILNFVQISFGFIILLILALPVEFWVGAQFWKGAFTGLKNLKANMDTPVVLATGAAFFYLSIGAAWPLSTSFDLQTFKPGPPK